MFKSFSTHILQHLIAQNAWACSMLQPFAGKSVRITIAPVHSTLVILEDGSLAIAGETNVPDASINIAPSLLPRLIAKDEAAKLQIEVTGDTHLATALAKVLSHLHWDYEDDLSKLIGDVPANKIGSFARSSVQSLKGAGINFANMLSEYWQEEKPMLAKKRHVDQFNHDVDHLRSDVERFEKRLQKLAKAREASTGGSQASDSGTTPNNQVTDSVK